MQANSGRKAENLSKNFPFVPHLKGNRAEQIFLTTENIFSTVTANKETMAAEVHAKHPAKHPAINEVSGMYQWEEIALAVYRPQFFFHF